MRTELAAAIINYIGCAKPDLKLYWTHIMSSILIVDWGASDEGSDYWLRITNEIRRDFFKGDMPEMFKVYDLLCKHLGLSDAESKSIEELLLATEYDKHMGVQILLHHLDTYLKLNPECR